jgi:FAD:protein FMN transferase
MQDRLTLYPMNSTTFYAMGSRIHIVFDESSPESEFSREELFRKARAWFQQWEGCLSRFLPESELCQLNQRSGLAVNISATMVSVLQSALKAARRTHGLVTPTILDALEAAGYDRSFERISPEMVNPDRKISVPDPQSWRQIELDVHAHTVRLPVGCRIDLGGIAKGWAADQALLRLNKSAPVLVDADGDIAVSRPRLDGQPWQIGIGRPEDASRHLAVLPVKQGGIATSGRNYRQWQQGKKRQHHLIDPRSGQPAETDVLSASVIAPSALEAEIAAKAVLILGSQAGLAWLEVRPRLAGLLVLEGGQVVYSRRFMTYIR